jgi:hypothetical protein
MAIFLVMAALPAIAIGEARRLSDRDHRYEACDDVREVGKPMSL